MDEMHCSVNYIYMSSSSHRFPVIIAITALNPGFWQFLIDVINRTHSKSIFSKRLLSVPKNIKWRDFANSSSMMLFSGNWNPAWKSTFTSDTTQILSFHVSEAKWCSSWWLKKKRSKGYLEADSWSSESEFLHSDCIAESWEAAELMRLSSHLMSNSWLILASREDMTFLATLHLKFGGA